jgi:medium-chain acyl-[acyl-carrier-protein] hydrolase
MTQAILSEPRWIISSLPLPRAEPRLRLFCLPHAGGAASAYLSWGRALGPAIQLWAVQPPGRESRLDEAPVADARAVIEGIATAMAPLLDRPFVIFGHSMGGILSLELARELRRRALPAPRRMFVSGSRCPTRPQRTPMLHRLGDADFLAEVSGRYNGIPQAVLETPELVELLLPALRADITLLELHQYVAEPPLDVPFTVFHGTEDKSLLPEEIQAWREVTTATCEFRALPGGHFYFHDPGSKFLQVLAAELELLAR